MRVSPLGNLEYKKAHRCAKKTFQIRNGGIFSIEGSLKTEYLELGTGNCGTLPLSRKGKKTP